MSVISLSSDDEEDCCFIFDSKNEEVTGEETETCKVFVVGGQNDFFENEYYSETSDTRNSPTRSNIYNPLDGEEERLEDITVSDDKLRNRGAEINVESLLPENVFNPDNYLTKYVTNENENAHFPKLLESNSFDECHSVTNNTRNAIKKQPTNSTIPGTKLRLLAERLAGVLTNVNLPTKSNKLIKDSTDQIYNNNLDNTIHTVSLVTYKIPERLSIGKKDSGKKKESGVKAVRKKRKCQRKKGSKKKLNSSQNLPIASDSLIDSPNSVEKIGLEIEELLENTDRMLEEINKKNLTTNLCDVNQSSNLHTITADEPLSKKNKGRSLGRRKTQNTSSNNTKVSKSSDNSEVSKSTDNLIKKKRGRKKGMQKNKLHLDPSEAKAVNTSPEKKIQLDSRKGSSSIDREITSNQNEENHEDRHNKKVNNKKSDQKSYEENDRLSNNSSQVCRRNSAINDKTNRNMFNNKIKFKIDRRTGEFNVSVDYPASNDTDFESDETLSSHSPIHDNSPVCDKKVSKEKENWELPAKTVNETLNITQEMLVKSREAGASAMPQAVISNNVDVNSEDSTEVDPIELKRLKSDFLSSYKEVFDDDGEIICMKMGDLLLITLKEVRHCNTRVSSAHNLVCERLRREETKNALKYLTNTFSSYRKSFVVMFNQIYSKIHGGKVIAEQHKALIIAWFIKLFLRVTSLSPEVSDCLLEVKNICVGLLSNGELKLLPVKEIFFRSDTDFEKDCWLVLNFMQDCFNANSSVAKQQHAVSETIGICSKNSDYLSVANGDSSVAKQQHAVSETIGIYSKNSDSLSVANGDSFVAKQQHAVSETIGICSKNSNSLSVANHDLEQSSYTQQHCKTKTLNTCDNPVPEYSTSKGESCNISAIPTSVIVKDGCGNIGSKESENIPQQSPHYTHGKLLSVVPENSKPVHQIVIKNSAELIQETNVINHKRNVQTYNSNEIHSYSIHSKKNAQNVQRNHLMTAVQQNCNNNHVAPYDSFNYPPQLAANSTELAKKFNNKPLYKLQERSVTRETTSFSKRIISHAELEYQANKKLKNYTYKSAACMYPKENTNSETSSQLHPYSGSSTLPNYTGFNTTTSTNVLNQHRSSEERSYFYLKGKDIDQARQGFNPQASTLQEYYKQRHLSNSYYNTISYNNGENCNKNISNYKPQFPTSRSVPHYPNNYQSSYLPSPNTHYSQKPVHPTNANMYNKSASLSISQQHSGEHDVTRVHRDAVSQYTNYNSTYSNPSMHMYSTQYSPCTSVGCVENNNSLPQKKLNIQPPNKTLQDIKTASGVTINNFNFTTYLPSNLNTGHKTQSYPFSNPTNNALKPLHDPNKQLSGSQEILLEKLLNSNSNPTNNGLKPLHDPNKQLSGGQEILLEKLLNSNSNPTNNGLKPLHDPNKQLSGGQELSLEKLLNSKT